MKRLSLARRMRLDGSLRLLQATLFTAGGILVLIAVAMYARGDWRSQQASEVAGSVEPPASLAEADGAVDLFPLDELDGDVGDAIGQVDADGLTEGLDELSGDAPVATAPDAKPTATPQPTSPAVVAPTEAPAPPSAPCASAPISGTALALFNAINAERAARGLAPLAVDGCATHVALVRATDMASQSRLTYVTLGGETTSSLLAGSGVSFASAAESLTRNNASDAAGRALSDLMTDPVQGANIFSPAFSRVGVGAGNANGMTYYAVIYLN